MAVPRSLSVAVVGANPSDSLWQAVEEAVEFWNGELGNSGVGDIIIALSAADFVSFGMRWSSARKGLVALKRADAFPMSLPNVPTNLVAHELGHVLGLRHNSDPATLMCGRPAPCRPDLFRSDTKRFFPLTAEDRATLRTYW
jgi:hypothetical protein